MILESSDLVSVGVRCLDHSNTILRCISTWMREGSIYFSCKFDVLSPPGYGAIVVCGTDRW